MIVVPMSESVELSVLGESKRGTLRIQNSSSVPIIHKGKAVGTAIVHIDYK